jgi:hypothetical protein
VSPTIDRDVREALRGLRHNAAVTAALDALEQDIIAAWSSTPLSDVQNREICFFNLLGLRQLRQQLDNWSRDTNRTGDE